MKSINMKVGGRIIIDGREFAGQNISINGNKVTVDGVVQDGELVGDIRIEIYGDVDHIDSGSGDVTVSGSAGTVSTMSGSVECGSVGGFVKTMSGNVTCGAVTGSVSTMSGNVRHK